MLGPCHKEGAGIPIPPDVKGLDVYVFKIYIILFFFIFEA